MKKKFVVLLGIAGIMLLNGGVIYWIRRQTASRKQFIDVLDDVD